MTLSAAQEDPPEGTGELPLRLTGPALVAALRSAVSGRLPVGVRAARVAPPRAALWGLGGLGLVGIVLAAVLAGHSGGRAVAADQPIPAGFTSGLPSSPAATSPVAPSSPVAVPSAPARSAGGTVLVDVAGRVRRPSVVALPAGSRVDDALAAAGGALPGVDLTTLDRARVLVDGEQLRVGIAGPAPAVPIAVQAVPTLTTGVPGSVATGPVDLNTASVEQLDALPGVGPVTAQKILDWRQQHGRFTSTAQLSQIKGLGGAKGQALLALVTAG